MTRFNMVTLWLVTVLKVHCLKKLGGGSLSPLTPSPLSPPSVYHPTPPEPRAWGWAKSWGGVSPPWCSRLNLWVVNVAVDHDDEWRNVTRLTYDVEVKRFANITQITIISSHVYSIRISVKRTHVFEDQSGGERPVWSLIATFTQLIRQSRVTPATVGPAVYDCSLYSEYTTTRRSTNCQTDRYTYVRRPCEWIHWW